MYILYITIKYTILYTVFPEQSLFLALALDKIAQTGN